MFTDKTGTITKGKMEVVKVLLGNLNEYNSKLELSDTYQTLLEDSLIYNNESEYDKSSGNVIGGNMFSLDNILTYTSANIQIIGIFIAIIGGLVATKILNTKIEKDTLIEKLSKIEKEIRFYKSRKLTDKEEVYKINKEDYIDYIYEKVEDKDFNIEDYADFNLTLEQRKDIVREIKETISSALKIFNTEHTKDDIPIILKQNHIKEGTTEYMIYEYVGENTRTRKTIGFGMFDPTDFVYPHIQHTSFSENLEERDLNNRIDKFDEFIEWKLVEKEDIKSRGNMLC